jgi:homeobox protein YOX1/YHP1
MALYDQSGWPANTCKSPSPTMYSMLCNHLDYTLTVHHPSTANQFPNDPRYATANPNYPSSTSRTSPSIPYDARNMPVTTHQGQYFPQAGETASSMMPGTHVRSPSSAGYPAQYTYGAQPQQTYYPNTDPRSLTSSMPGMQYDSSTGAAIPRRSSLSVDRTVPSRVSQHGLPPYARGPPVIPQSYDQESITEPTIKKKRKRAGKPSILSTRSGGPDINVRC